jgi:hypothetical protein
MSLSIRGPIGSQEEITSHTVLTPQMAGEDSLNDNASAHL